LGGVLLFWSFDYHEWCVDFWVIGVECGCVENKLFEVVGVSTLKCVSWGGWCFSDFVGYGEKFVVGSEEEMALMYCHGVVYVFECPEREQCNFIDVHVGIFPWYLTWILSFQEKVTKLNS